MSALICGFDFSLVECRLVPVACDEENVFPRERACTPGNPSADGIKAQRTPPRSTRIRPPLGIWKLPVKSLSGDNKPQAFAAAFDRCKSALESPGEGLGPHSSAWGHWAVFIQLGTCSHGLFLRDKRTSGGHK